jgi:SET domain-containing protein
MKTYLSPKTEKRASDTEGTGLFATSDIQKGEIIAIKNGHLVTRKEAKELANKIGDYYQQIDDDVFLSAKTIDELEDTMVNINHSCEPSCGIYGRATHMAMRDIKAGEELSYDIAMTTDDPDYSFACNCKSANCRGKFTGLDWQRNDLQEKYGEFFTTFILIKIKSL